MKNSLASRLFLVYFKELLCYYKWYLNYGGIVLRKVVLYFSEFGNTESIARRIAEKTGADICKIEPVEPYPENLQEVMEIGQNETDNGTMRPIKQLEVDLSKYDKVILGMPTWWYHAPPCVESF